QALKLDRVGVEDNFFELGGDSILSIQIIARANQAGLRLTPKDLFQRQTIASLAAACSQRPSEPSEPDIPEGAVPLTPIQDWFLGRSGPAPEHFNQALLLRSGSRLDPAALRRALEGILEHHDALRLRFHPTPSGWEQLQSTGPEAAPLTTIDLLALDEPLRRAALDEACEAGQRSLDLGRGPLLRALHIRLTESGEERLLLAVHHLAVDGVSWRILL